MQAHSTNGDAFRRGSWSGQTPSPPTEPPPHDAEHASAPLPMAEAGLAVLSPCLSRRLSGLPPPLATADRAASRPLPQSVAAAKPFRSASLPFPPPGENAAPSVDWSLTGSSFIDPPSGPPSTRPRQVSGSGVSDMSSSSRHSGAAADFKPFLTGGDRAWASTVLPFDVGGDDSAGSKGSSGMPTRAASASFAERDALLRALPHDLLQSESLFGGLADVTNVCGSA